MDDFGNCFFSTLSGGTIHKISANGDSTVWATSLCPNGQALLYNGHHLVCDSKLGALIRYDNEGNFVRTEIDKSCAGEIIHVPNDVITDKKGNIYFTDSIRENGKIGFINTDGHEKIIAKNLDYPNGLAMSNDEKTLFVAESYKNRIIAYDVTDEGLVTDQFRIVCNLPEHPSKDITNNLPDGLKVDQKNNLWVAHYGMGMIHVVAANGTLLHSIQTSFRLPSNLFIKNNMITITGGYAEPGPGGLLQIEWEYE